MRMTSKARAPTLQSPYHYCRCILRWIFGTQYNCSDDDQCVNYRTLSNVDAVADQYLAWRTFRSYKPHFHDLFVMTGPVEMEQGEH